MKNTQNYNVIFIHGLESSGHGFKGRLLKELIPQILTPDFEPFDPNVLMYDLLPKRMDQLNRILNSKNSLVLIGSSFGGLMASLFVFQNPKRVEKMILLAPLLVSRKLKPRNHPPMSVPVIVFHGKNDKIVKCKHTRERAKLLFTNLQYTIVDDDHSLHKTVKSLNWHKLIFNT
ncbi:MAG: YqiA/YcfP family alpha/beta fold hydrolase [Promethearchaeota archaeon]|jgi:pimeloyl-ACP methyl ester carboxylesterase